MNKISICTLLFIACLNTVSSQSTCVSLVKVSSSATNAVLAVYLIDNGTSAALVSDYTIRILPTAGVQNAMPIIFSSGTTTVTMPALLGNINVQLTPGASQIVLALAPTSEVFSVTGMIPTTLCNNVVDLIVLPVSLTSFQGKITEGGNILSWQTAYEANVSHFDVESATNNSNFVKIGEIKAKGNAANYEFMDKHPLSNFAYYRLKSHDLDGKADFSKVIALQSNGKSKVKIYPTSVSEILVIEGATNFDVINMAGQIAISQRNEGTSEQRNSVNVSQLASGIYIVKGMDTEGSVFSEKITKQ